MLKKVEIPSGLVLPSYSYEIYVGPDDKCANRRPPQNVLDFFKENNIKDWLELPYQRKTSDFSIEAKKIIEFIPLWKWLIQASI